MTSSSTTTQSTGTAATSTAKPIKLRSACNNCFTAKVKCDGNKQGCRRCLDRRLECHYSESRVGKVVGKRRKRPLPETNTSTSTSSSKSSQSSSSTPLPSPCSDIGLTRQDSMLSWDSFVSYDDCGPMHLDSLPTSSHEQYFPSMNEMNHSPTCGTPMFVNNGLPTPGMSPIESSILESTYGTSRSSRGTSVSTESSSLFSSVSSSSSNLSTPVMPKQTLPNEDEETICIKLLAHLKKTTAGGHQSHEAQLSLVRKTNAVIRRLMRSSNVRSDYSCLLLLSTIASHLVTMCESLIAEAKSIQDEYMQDQFASNYMEAVADYFDAALIMPLQSTLTSPSSHNFASLQHDIALSAKAAVHEAAVLVGLIGDCLKRSPIEGFEQLGRHESLHIDLDKRLIRSLQAME